MAKDIKNLEIFAAGTWKGDTFSEADLDSMVSAFYSLGMHIPLKLGHSEAQRWFGQDDGHPALGWVTKLKRSGAKLLADIENIPDALFSLFETKRYRAVSSEVYMGYTGKDGRTWPRALRAVSVLGAEPPAVSNLAGIQAALMSDAQYSISYSDGEKADVRSYVPEDHAQTTPDKEKKMDKVQELEAKIVKLSDDLTSERKSREEAEARAVKAEATLRTRDRDMTIKHFAEVTIPNLKREGKVAPAEEADLKATFESLVDSPVRKFGDKEMKPSDHFIETLNKRAKVVSYKERAEGEKDNGGQGDGEEHPSVTVDKKVQKFMEDNPAKTYADGINHVKRTDSELWKRYLTA